MRKIITRAHSNVLIDVSDLVQIDFRICAVKQLQFLMFVSSERNAAYDSKLAWKMTVALTGKPVNKK